jgi:hypothetical protein
LREFQRLKDGKQALTKPVALVYEHELPIMDRAIDASGEMKRLEKWMASYQ